jgi:uncharacterized membrane protein
MSGGRSAIFDWAQQQRLAPAAVPMALRLAGVTPDAARWRQFIDRLLLGLSVLMVAAGAIFFLTFNWHELGRYAKFALAEMPIVVAIAACWRFGLDSTPGKAALVAAALFTGALLALVGQTYQTGADTFELFALWALAITAWVAVSRLPALWLLWLAILHVAIFLYLGTFDTILRGSFGLREMLWLVFALDTLALIAWEGLAASGIVWLRERWAVRVIAFTAGTAVTALAVWSGFDHKHADASPLVAYFAYVAWLAAVLWAYRWRTVDLFVLAGAVLSVIVVVTVALSSQLIGHGGAGAFLLIGLVVIAGAAAGAWWLRGIAAGDRT